MTKGDIDSQIVEAPITVAKINTAAGLAITNTSDSSLISIASFNQGRSLVVVAKEE